MSKVKIEVGELPANGCRFADLVLRPSQSGRKIGVFIPAAELVTMQGAPSKSGGVMIDLKNHTWRAVEACEITKAPIGTTIEVVND